MNLTVKYFDELTPSELYEILKSRGEIFLIEQQIMYLDMDDVDYNSLHIFLTEGKRVTAYLRAFYADDTHSAVQVGRVLSIRHGIGLGRELMEKALPVIKEKMPCRKITMHAQKHAAEFYEKFGFKVVSDEFLEEGIVHVTMEMEV